MVERLSKYILVFVCMFLNVYFVTLWFNLILLKMSISTEYMKYFILNEPRKGINPTEVTLLVIISSRVEQLKKSWEIPWVYEYKIIYSARRKIFMRDKLPKKIQVELFFFWTGNELSYYKWAVCYFATNWLCVIWFMDKLWQTGT